MNHQHPLALARAACLLLAMAGAHAKAQAELPVQAAAADPQAAVPATRYQSALSYRPAEAAATSPDRNWVASNQLVAATNSMALTMKARPAAHAADPHAGHARQDHAADEHSGHDKPASAKHKEEST
jgi:hypothetical protein